ncbi:MAG: DNA-processing protein DprA [Actinomycetota bacterium]
MSRLIRRSDAEYPALLREIPDPPTRLFLAGRPLEPGPAVAVVGARRASSYGLEVAHWLASELAAAGLTVVSGMARGIDGAAHRGALDVRGSTVAVLGCGLDVCYPAMHRQLYEQIKSAGSLISEHEAGVRPMPQHFPVRNRIIAGMSLGVVVVEAVPGGGAMITARLAGEYGRDLFAVPGPVHSAGASGPHLLIREGARLAASAGQILDDLGLACPAPPPGQPVELHPDESRLMKVLAAQPQLVDLLAGKVRMPVSTVSAVLVKLEMKKLVTRYPGGRYACSVGAQPP